jgi:hypothetical protein
MMRLGAYLRLTVVKVALEGCTSAVTDKCGSEAGPGLLSLIVLCLSTMHPKKLKHEHLELCSVPHRCVNGGTVMHVSASTTHVDV